MSQFTSGNQWQSDLSKYITDILSKIVALKVLNAKVNGSTVLSRYIDNKAMTIWTKAFTHESFDPNSNYEGLEYYGDRMLKSVFAKYVMEKYPNYRQGEYNEIDRVNMSKNKQGKLAEDLGLVGHIRMDPLLKDRAFAIGADVFESFTGALAKISDSIIENSGFVACFSFIKYVFNDGIGGSKLEITNISGDPKTIYVQIFRQLQIEKTDVPKVEESGIRFKLSLSQVMMSRINDILTRSGSGRTVQSNLISQIDNTNYMSDKTVEHKVYQQALNNLKSLYCIDQNYAKEYKNYMDRYKVHEKGLLIPLDNKLAEAKLVDPYFKQPTKSTTKEKINFVQLIGKDSQGMLHILGTGSGNTPDEAMINSVKNYLSKF